MIDTEDIKRRFAYHAPTGRKGEQHAGVRSSCLSLALTLNTIVPDGREKALMMTHLEEVMMWGNAGIAREPVIA